MDQRAPSGDPLVCVRGHFAASGGAAKPFGFEDDWYRSRRIRLRLRSPTRPAPTGTNGEALLAEADIGDPLFVDSRFDMLKKAWIRTRALQLSIIDPAAQMAECRTVSVPAVLPSNLTERLLTDGGFLVPGSDINLEQ